jgi:hypothetical protein
MAILRVLDEVATVLPEAPPVGLDVADLAVLQSEVERLRSQMKRQRALFELGEYGDDLGEYQRRRRALEAQVAALERQLASTGPSSLEFRRRWETLRHWEAAYEGAGSVREKQRVWGALVEQVVADGSVLSVRLRDFGQAGGRQWELGLPPLRTRRPGAGQRA